MLDRAIVTLSNLVMAVAGVALTLMMVHVTADVVGKYFFNAPVPMTLELVSAYYMVGVVFLPLMSVERINGNIQVELIAAVLPPLAQRLLDILAYVLSAGFFGALTLYTWRVAVDKFEVGEFIMGSYSVITWPSRFIVPVGAGLVSMLLVLKLVRAIARLARGDTSLPEGEAQHGAGAI
ncbi:TRAP transporter small permease subunit [Acuticoccus sp.]|uniref:TRAP transporter small permease subunit n=1 Tax=Acuticoccus sp. TaxID=1904378 RepID=UPI003B524A17